MIFDVRVNQNFNIFIFKGKNTGENAWWIPLYILYSSCDRFVTVCCISPTMQIYKVVKNLHVVHNNIYYVKKKHLFVRTLNYTCRIFYFLFIRLYKKKILLFPLTIQITINISSPSLSHRAEFKLYYAVTVSH